MRNLENSTHGDLDRFCRLHTVLVVVSEIVISATASQDVRRVQLQTHFHFSKNLGTIQLTSASFNVSDEHSTKLFRVFDPFNMRVGDLSWTRRRGHHILEVVMLFDSPDVS